MMPEEVTDRTLYIFLDEGGDLNFSVKGTKYFTISCITKFRPFIAYKELNEFKYDLMESGFAEIEYFHASEDRQVVRDKVFDVINNNFKDSIVDSIIIQKNKTHYYVRKEERFYKDMFGYLIKYVLDNTDLSKIRKIIIITDRLPVKEKEKCS